MHQCIKLFYFGMTLYMFRTVFPSIIRSSRLYIQQQAYVKQILRVPASKQSAVSAWRMLVTVCTVLNSWWWTERPSETCRLSFQNKTIWNIGASSWIYYRNILRCTAQWTSNPLHFTTTQTPQNVDVIISVFQIEIFSDFDGKNNEVN